MSDHPDPPMGPGPGDLVPEVYAHLRALAGRMVDRDVRATLRPTDIVHEAWLKLDGHASRFESRAHFMAVAAKAMRQILIDRARRRSADKRGGGLARVTLAGIGAEDPPFDLLDLEAALAALTEVDPKGAEIVELRYLGGLSVTEAAELLGMSRSAVQASWRLSRAFLLSRLGGPPG
jgi:RNA polymerase sigma-70 factor, ECF subfamily